MEPSSSQQQETQNPIFPRLEILVIETEAIGPAPDELPDASFINSPPDSVPSNISEDMLGRICLRHGLLLDDVILPGPDDRSHNAPEGYTAFNRHACAAGTLPPFNDYIREVLAYLDIAPSQLHPNRYASLNSLFIVFMEYLHRPPRMTDIRYLFNFKSRTDSPSFTFLESVRNCQVVAGSWTRLSYFKSEWFYVRCPPGFARRWLFRREYCLFSQVIDRAIFGVKLNLRLLLFFLSAIIQRPEGGYYKE